MIVCYYLLIAYVVFRSEQIWEGRQRPGLLQASLTKKMQHLFADLPSSPKYAEGVDTPLWLALDQVKGGPSGQFWNKRAPLEWD